MYNSSTLKYSLHHSTLQAYQQYVQQLFTSAELVKRLHLHAQLRELSCTTLRWTSIPSLEALQSSKLIALLRLNHRLHLVSIAQIGDLPSTVLANQVIRRVALMKIDQKARRVVRRSWTGKALLPELVSRKSLHLPYQPSRFVISGSGLLVCARRRAHFNRPAVLVSELRFGHLLLLLASF